MNTLPLPVTLQTNISYTQNVQIYENSKSAFYVTNNPYRNRVRENIQIQQYHDDLITVRTFLLNHHGIPFIWEKDASKSYFCLNAQFVYKSYLNNKLRGDVSLTLILNTNNAVTYL